MFESLIQGPCVHRHRQSMLLQPIDLRPETVETPDQLDHDVPHALTSGQRSPVPFGLPLDFDALLLIGSHEDLPPITTPFCPYMVILRQCT